MAICIIKKLLKEGLSRERNWAGAPVMFAGGKLCRKQKKIGGQRIPYQPFLLLFGI
jgi:hypothetical protein